MHGTMSRLRLRPPRLPLTPTRPRFLAPAAALALTVPLALAGTASATAATTAAAPTVTVNGAATYQRITGFGASEAFGQAETLQNQPAAVQQQVLNLLYGTSGGAGLTMLRNEISADAGTTIEPTAPASPSAAPTYLPLSAIADDGGQLWWAQTIKHEYGVTQDFADAWSAPAFMKTNDSVDNGGTLCGVPGATCASGDWRQAYANYLAQYARDYAQAGVPLSYVGPENEANIGPGYDSMIMSPAQTANFMEYLGPTLARSGLRTRAECCATEGWDYAQQYAAAIEADPKANAWTPLFTSHGYTAPPNSPLTGWTKAVWETEWSTFETYDTAWNDGTDASGLSWAQRIYTGLTSANLNAFLYWWGMTTTTENGDNEGLVQLDTSTGTVTPSGRLWAFANYSRFVRPGAIRIGASSANSDLDVTAFRNVNGTVAIVVLNTAASSQTASFSVRGTGASGPVATPYLTDNSHDTAAQAPLRVVNGSFGTTLPAGSLTTFVIR
jgi:O-glycosyl hydrolase